MVDVVGLTVGGRFASVVISRLINGLIDCSKGWIESWGELETEMNRLEKALPKIEAVVSAIDQDLFMDENPALKRWLWQLRDASDMADDVMDEFEYNAAKEKAEAEETKENDSKFDQNDSDFGTLLKNYVKGKMETGRSKVKKAVDSFRTSVIKRLFKKDPILKKLKEAVKAIDEVAADVEVFYMIVQNMERKKENMVKQTTSDRETGSLLTETRVFGRNNEKEDIVKKLLNPGSQPTGTNFCVLPVVGVGGVGKTTLAQLVYNDQRVEKHFELRLWVCVSNTFDVVLLTKKLYESAFGEKADFDNFDSIQRKLAYKLESKKFLVVFDDAWNDNNEAGWQKLLAPLKSGANGSMILLTTRSKSVARTMGSSCMNIIFLKGLKDDDYWNLFLGCVFSNENPNHHMKLLEIGKVIVKKLKGSPLAAKTVGGILRANLYEKYWTSILESEIWSLRHEEHGIMPALILSYQHLASHLKPCFSFCSLFPQDHKFKKEVLVEMWRAVGLVPRNKNGNKRPEDIGSEFFDELVKKSFFKREGNIYFMHDLLHDLATFVSREECFRFIGGNLTSIPRTIRHLHARVSDPSEFNISALKHLRTLILYFDQTHPELLYSINGIINGLKKLRILWITFDHLCEFPDNINDLLHLRYLFFYGKKVEILPKKKVKLYLLEIMIFREPPCIGPIIGPPYPINNIEKLINLRRIEFPCHVHVTLFSVGRLTSLQYLGTSFRVEEADGCKISELKNMIELRKLTITGLNHVGSHEEAIQAKLKNKVNLYCLYLDWDQTLSNENYDIFHEELLDHLEPHHHLKSLTINNQRGRRPPIWMRTQFAFHLVEIYLWSCAWKYLPSLDELPYLKTLCLHNMNNLEKLCLNCKPTTRDSAFRSLKRIDFDNLSRLEEWCVEPSTSMSCLRTISVTNCLKLSSLPSIPSCLEELSLRSVGLVALPKWQVGSTNSHSLPSIKNLMIVQCSKLTSLSEGMLEHPEHLTTLKKLIIMNCKNLVYLPEGGFSKFTALRELYVGPCPRLQGHMMPECFLPSSLQTLILESCVSLDATLPKALENIVSLVSMDLRNCAITSLPSRKILSRWKKLRSLKLSDCNELESLESLHALSLKTLDIRRCSKLITMTSLRETSDQLDICRIRPTSFQKLIMACSSKTQMCLRSLLSLCTLMFAVLKMIASRLNVPTSTETVPTLQPIPTALEDMAGLPLYSVQYLTIDDPQLLSVEPLKNLSSVRELKITNCSKLLTLPVTWLLQNYTTLQQIELFDLYSLESLPIELKNLLYLRTLELNEAPKLQSLPELPPLLEELRVEGCSEELKRRCMETGEDWPKLSHVPRCLFWTTTPIGARTRTDGTLF